jgi:hypothetical protein
VSAFIKLPTYALTDDRLSHRDLRVLMALYSFGANPGDVVWPSRKAICDLTRIKAPHVSVSMSRLIDFGWIERKQCGPNPNQYTLRLPEVTESVTVTKTVAVTDSVPRSYRNGTKEVTESVRHITDQEQTKEQTNTAQRVREEDKQPSGASGGGEGPHNGDSAKPKTARAISMTDTWTPSEDCWRLVDKAGIPRDFAESMMGEFRLYWRDEGTRRKSWNATFLNRVKDQWARRKPSLRVISHATHQRPDNSAPGKVARAIAERDAQQSAGAGVPGNDCIELGQADYYAVAY